MAEGVDNDMNQQQREQASVPHGQEADRTPQVHFSSSATNLQTGLPSQPIASSNNFGPNPGHKKKSSFQITSVTETKVHNRGDSNGYDAELDLNESDIVTEEVEVEVETVVEPGTGNGNGGSRFKVVKIPRTENYNRGRWKCHDFPDAESSTQTSSSSGAGGASITTNTSTQPSRENVEKTDVHSNAKPSTTSNSIGNHIANESDSSQPEVQTHASSVRSSTQANEQSSNSSDIGIVALRKKDSNSRLGVISELSTKQGDSSVAESSLENVERIFQEGGQSIASSTSLGGGESEMPIVNKIASAMEQITQIKSDLLSVVNKEVQTLKETISKLTEENQELKLENEKLRNLVDSKSSPT